MSSAGACNSAGFSLSEILAEARLRLISKPRSPSQHPRNLECCTFAFPMWSATRAAASCYQAQGAQGALNDAHQADRCCVGIWVPRKYNGLFDSDAM